MLRLVRFRGAGSFNPRNDGPLMTGASFGAEGRGASGFRVDAGAAAAGEGSAVVCMAAA